MKSAWKNTSVTETIIDGQETKIQQLQFQLAEVTRELEETKINLDQHIEQIHSMRRNQALVKKSFDLVVAERDSLLSFKTKALGVIKLCRIPRLPDPEYYKAVKELGSKIGYGTLMSTASYCWREILDSSGNDLGGEFTVGPCRATIESFLSDHHPSQEKVKDET